MDISEYAVGPEGYDTLSRWQISNFFASKPSPTKDECDSLAASVLGGPVSETPMQGANSYTVERHGVSKVVQFRSSQLDIAKLELVQQVYGRFVPQYVYHGKLGIVHVYVWNRVSGPAFCRVRKQTFTSDKAMERRLRQTIQDFAKFFALAWLKKPSNLTPPPPKLQDNYIAILNKLLRTLPESLHPKIHMVRQSLDLLFRPDFPIALQHGNLLENNIHVEEETGHITGVVDWQEAFVAPFGLSLVGVETLLGAQTNSDWHFHPSHVELRQLFWDTFYSEVGQVSDLDKETIEIARLMGLFQTHGFEENGKSGVYLEKLTSVYID